jgi:hypothetical protein
MQYQQAQLRWVWDNPVPDTDKQTLYLVNATLVAIIGRESTKTGKWFTKLTISDVTGQYDAKIFDGNSGEIPQSYIGQIVAFNIKAQDRKSVV